MAFYLSPLVDVNEIDLSTTIPAVATSIGVIALRNTYKGAEGKQTFVTDEQDLIRAFGEPESVSYEDVLSALGFLKYGNKLYGTRVMSDDATLAGVTIPVGSGLTVDIDTIADGVGATTGSIVGGSGYSDDTAVATTGGTGTGLTVDTTTVTGAVTVVAINAGGTGYTAADVLTITGGGADATFVVSTISDGVVTAVTMNTSGTGYSDTQVVEVTGGSGTGLTVTVTDSNADGVPESVAIAWAGSGYAVDTDIATFSDADAFVHGGYGLEITVDDTGDGVLQDAEISIKEAGIGFVALDEYVVQGGNLDGVIVIDSADSDGVVTGISVKPATGGTGYLDGDYTVLPDFDYDLPTMTLDDLPSGDPDDFGDDVTVTTAGDKIWAIASSRGMWGNNVKIAFLDYATQRDMLTGVLDPDTYVDGGSFEQFAGVDSVLDKNVAISGDPNGSKDFLVAVMVKDQRKTTYVLKEIFNVTTDPDELDDGGDKRFVEDVINQQSNYMRVAVDATIIDENFDPTLVNDGWYQFKGGFNGNLGVDDASIIEAYQLYEDPETIDVNIIIDSNKSETVKSALVTLCEDRLDCMLTADCPKELVVNNKGNETVDLRDWRNGTGSFTTTNFNENTSYAALYGNWLEVYDKYNQKYRWIPASGYMAGIYARTDDVAEPWFAPAGLNRSVLTGIRRLAWNAKQGNRDILYSNGINPIVSFAGQGKVVWGQKTMLAKSSAFDRINVRRLFMVLEKAISTAAKYFLFEPNDTATRVLLVAMIEPFLRDVQSRRGIFDFKVICDDSNNTPERIDRNELWCDILIKPTRTAEFIVLNFVATKTGASFEEAAQAI
jgi:hypothetical protein